MSKMVSVVQPLLVYYPVFSGGPALSLFSINSELGSDIKVTVITTLKGQNKNSYNHSLSDTHTIFYTKRFIHVFLDGLRLLNRSDVLQLSSLFFPPNIILYLIYTLARKKVIVSPRGELFDPALHQGRPMLKRLFLLIYKFNKSKTCWVATSKEEADVIRTKIEPTKIKIIPNYLKLKERSNCQHSWTRNILYMGRLSNIKNIHLILEALFLKKESGEIYQLNIMGEAWTTSEKQYKDRLQVLVNQFSLENQVIFHGHLTGKAKYSVMTDCDALFLVSSSENFGNVVLEALAYSIPVVASHGTPWNKLDKNQAGFFISGSLGSIVKALEEFDNLSNDDYRQMCKNAYELYTSTYQLSDGVKCWREVYIN